MTIRSGTGKGALSGAPTPASIHADAMAALIVFAGEQRLVGGLQAHESFDGILREHLIVLIELRDLLQKGFRQLTATAIYVDGFGEAMGRLDAEIAYLRALSSVAEETG